jgi:predicted nucleic acid-binding protein
VPDLLIAATAEAANLAILHYDAGFDLIASVTSQACQWIAPAGSID